MANETSTRPSFSRGKKWSIALNVALATLIVLAVVVMVNYLSGRYFERVHLSSRTRVELSPRTVHFVRSITNDVQITLYYDKDEPLYGDVAELLKEYRSINPKLAVATVDYYRDPGKAEELKVKYNLGASTNRNLVIFESDGRTKVVPGELLAQYTLEAVENPTAREFRRKPVAFNGEMMFTGALLAVINPEPLNAYFLQGHGEHRIEDSGDVGFMKFASILQQNYVRVSPLTLLGTNTVPEDCNLLVIAGATDPIPERELALIEQYLNEGGRLLVLLNFSSIGRDIGLEKILAKWGVEIGSAVVKDPDFTTVGSDVLVGDFSKHPAVNALMGSRLQLILPRPVRAADASATADIARVYELAFSGPRSYLASGDSAQPAGAVPLMAAVEQIAAKAITERGATRIIAVGDSLFLGNRQIQSGANRDFASYAANWLLERGVLLEGIGPRPVTEFRLLVSRKQMQSLQWILLGAIPGGILLLGSVVWLRRRK